MCLARTTQSIFANTEDRIASLLAKQQTYPDLNRIVLEPTGGYERLVVRRLQEARLPVSKVNALLIRHFAKDSGILAETDQIDAFVLADYGQRMSPRLLAEMDETRQKLADYVTRRRQLTFMLVQEKNRLEKPDNPARGFIETSIKFLKQQRREVEDQMRRTCITCPENHFGYLDDLEGHRLCHYLCPDCRITRDWSAGKRPACQAGGGRTLKSR